MSRDITPAIVRSYCDADRAANVVGTPTDRVTFSRGYGESGYRVEVVEHECPVCGFDRMIRRHDVHAELRDEVRYWCLYPNCVHFVADHLSHACHGNYPQRSTDEPAVFD